MVEEKNGSTDIKIKFINNDGKKDSLILLNSLKNLIKTQLPNMPAEYITRLVLDKNHSSLIIVKRGSHVVGGITYRLFSDNNLAEIVFCAVSSTEQAKGHGSFMMNNLKDHLKDNCGIRYLMTYADNHAMGFFKKNGFTTDITIKKKLWVGYIKDYDEATMMQLELLLKVQYHQIDEILSKQKSTIQKLIFEHRKNVPEYPGLAIFKNNNKSSIDPMEIPGIRESGWTPEMEAKARGNKKTIRDIMAIITSELKKHAKSWPFRDPVKPEEVHDYYTIIKNPMDLSTIESKVESKIYKSIEEYINDVRTIFKNCRIYNSEGTIYVKFANSLEKFFNNRLEYYDVHVDNK
nr:8756_t:CDS:1 [Entrophospora candida]CAG8438637.1 3844_t:CDS:1 [Entrophospora candida]